VIEEAVQIDIRHAASDVEYADARDLIRAYFDALRRADPAAESMLDAYFENHDIESELAQLPSTFGLPNGACLIAYQGDRAVGIVMLSRQSETRCEMNRMFVSVDARGLGLGQNLCERIIATARDMGFRKMTLETMPFLRSALAIYERNGFVPYAGTDQRFINLKLNL